MRKNQLLGTPSWAGWLFVAPALLMFTAVVMVPIVWSSYLSLGVWNGLGKWRFNAGANYLSMLSDTVFRHALLNSLFFSLVGSLIQLIVGMAMAVSLISIARFRNIVRVPYFLPAVISSVAISQIFVQLLSADPEGFINGSLRSIGLGEHTQPFLSNTSLTLTIVTLVDAYKFCAIYMAIFYSALVSLDQDVLAAAEIDGANRLQQLFLIRLPLIWATIAASVVLVVSGTLRGFDIPFVMTGGGPGTSSELVSTYMYKTLFSQSNFGYGSAIAIFLVVECLLIVAIIRKAFSATEKTG
ncbi:N-acetyl-D-glucosamine ABC transport system, permease protein 1 [Devosia sp. LC5]|uniref:carbohydrate ABC transporter permease n=1 Tax=Devosia sp. LC5 TaxID=1502724 RepID=UPI0004E4606C|nr:sugar ABC transporter permease [Devosia sp. LC5]KFC70625.1 N-acetyl-D-glucosamine ABC transport system, permease protein 1 [Devosia sp. LC5]